MSNQSLNSTTQESRPPLRVIVRVNTNLKALELVGKALYAKIKQADKDGDEAARENVSLNASIQVHDGHRGGRILCEKVIPVKLRGGIWVHNTKTGFAEEVIKALRAICGRGADSMADFDWLEGAPPERNAMGVIIPTPAFCTGEDDEVGHPRGRELIRRFLCGTCCAVVKESGSADVYTPFVPADSFPKGLHPRGRVSHWANQTMDCSGKDRPKVSKKGELSEFTGTGIGTGGIVSIDSGTFTGGATWKLWSPVGENWGNPAPRGVTGARVLAHELAHLALGCEGKLLSGIKVPPDKVDKLYDMPEDKDERAEWEAEIRKLQTEFKNGRATGTFRGLDYNVPLNGFTDLGEYDAILDWENEIAAELEPDDPPGWPRFSHG